MKPLVAVVLGTRPEAIKLAPVARALAAEPGLRAEVWATGQHRELARSVLADFGVVPALDLDLMRPGQTLSGLAAAALAGLDPPLERAAPALVLVQGDTTTALAAALAAFHRRVPVGHVEAGLRTADVFAPWPEEMNRRLVTRLATLHFAATPAAAANLHREGVPADAVHVVGNPVVDALLATAARVRAAPPAVPGLPADFLSDPRRIVLVTVHRRESFGTGVRGVFRAVRALADRFPNDRFVVPVHPNPEVRAAADEALRPGAPPNVFAVDPLPYPAFVAVFARACLALSDSGGVQEEAPALGVPVLLLRDTTERPEAVDAGTVELVGTDPGRIEANAVRLLSDPAALAARAVRRDVFGDGTAGQQIAAICAAFVAGRCP